MVHTASNSPLRRSTWQGTTQEEGAGADNWHFDVLWAAREAIEAANPWDNEAFFSVVIAGRTLDLCVTIDTTSGSALHIFTAVEAQR